MGQDRRRATVSLVATAMVALVAAAALAPSSVAQTNPIEDLLTPTTQPAGPETTAPEDVPPSDTAPPGAEDAQGDGAPAPEGGIVVPAEAQEIIDSVRRSGPSSNDAVLASLSGLVALGMTQDEAYRYGLGRFPVAGPARYSHDWLYPRYGPGFRFHLGTDVFAAHGTPLRAPVDGVATTGQDTLGGLSVKVTMADGTYFYLAHLSGLVDGFTDGMPVTTGDIVGYVGDSGNARGGSPHVHVGIYPKGGPAADPKPILDQFLDEALDHIPRVAAAWSEAHPRSEPAEVPALPVDAEARLLRPTLGTRLVHAFTSGDGWSPALLLVLGSDPAAGAGYLVQRSLDDLAASIDWSER